MISRVTTLGTEDSKYNSALYLVGEDMNINRFMNLTIGTKAEYEKVKLRRKWTAYLKKNEVDSSAYTKYDIKEAFRWGRFFRTDLQSLKTLLIN